MFEIGLFCCGIFVCVLSAIQNYTIVGLLPVPIFVFGIVTMLQTMEEEKLQEQKRLMRQKQRQRAKRRAAQNSTKNTKKGNPNEPLRKTS